MRNFFSTLALCFLLAQSNTALSQKHYEPGYVVLQNGDTIRGIVKDRTPEPFGELYERIRFKSDGIFAKKYDPLDVVSYRAGDRLYESHYLEAIPLVDNNFFNRFKGEGEQTFLLVRIKGALSYYHNEWEDHDSGYYDFDAYLKKADSPHFEFVRISIWGYNKKKMAAYLSDCPLLVKLLNDGGDPSLPEIVTIYNEKCTD